MLKIARQAGRSSMSDVHELDAAASLAQRARRLNKPGGREAVREGEGEESARRCFAYLRGTRERALMLEFRRYSDGGSFAMPYSWLGPHLFHPSHGIALVFAGPLSYVVSLIGHHLNTVTDDISLYERGILRQKVTWIAERKPARTFGAPEEEDNTADPCVVEEIRIQTARTDEEVWLLLEPWHAALRAASSAS
ncbi:MAG: hypothetical protein U0746_02900 [Gemmataceae bacterium]